MKRKKLSNRKSRKMFTKGATRSHKLNFNVRIMRGGYRL